MSLALFLLAKGVDFDKESSIMQSKFKTDLLSYMSLGTQYVSEKTINVNLRINIHRSGNSCCDNAINHF